MGQYPYFNYVLWHFSRYAHFLQQPVQGTPFSSFGVYLSARVTTAKVVFGIFIGLIECLLVEFVPATSTA